jgi:hypothetical protein
MAICEIKMAVEDLIVVGRDAFQLCSGVRDGDGKSMYALR